MIGDLYLKKNNISDAVEQFEWIANYYLKQNVVARALAMYRRISRIDSKNVKNLYTLAALYWKQGLKMETEQIYLHLAGIFKEDGKPGKVQEVYERILDINENNLFVREELAASFLKKDQIDRAVDMLGHQIAGYHKKGRRLLREMFEFCSFDCQTGADSLSAGMAFFRLLMGLLTSGLDS